MVLCPKCNTELGDDVTECYVCGSEITDKDEEGWIVLGTIEDKISADFAREALASYEIPAVVFSRSGVFGAAGLPLYSFYSDRPALFEVSVPASHVSEAIGVLDMVIGDRWQRADEKEDE